MKTSIRQETFNIMESQLKYMPIFRGRQEELKVLKSFNFQNGIYPCIEIIKEVLRRSKKQKTFEEIYFPIISSIKAKHVFVDLPVHLKDSNGMQLETLTFLRSVVSNRLKRTIYIKKLSFFSSKIIPVISTYSQKTPEKGSIILQTNDLRSVFPVLAFRTFMSTFNQDIKQIESVLKKTDYIIMDWGSEELDLSDGDQNDIVQYLKNINCTIIVHRSSYNNDISMANLTHGEVVGGINNNLIKKYKDFSGHCFSDYAGIKKDFISDGGMISPGFVYYDAVDNDFYGFRYANGGHRKGEVSPILEEFETRIVPAVINSEASERMRKNRLDYLGPENFGWKILTNIHSGNESGKSAPKFKRIGLEHYLHCIRTNINNGNYD